MEKMNFYGVGPKTGRIILPYLAIAITLTIIFRSAFTFGEGLKTPLLIAGIILLVLGLTFYGITVKLLLRGLKDTKLVTTGSYALCQNPLYSAIILMIIPGLSFVLNSWLIITTSVIAYIVFRFYIKSEYREMERIFGKTYLDYQSRTNEFFPFPFRK